MLLFFVLNGQKSDCGVSEGAHATMPFNVVVGPCSERRSRAEINKHPIALGIDDAVISPPKRPL